MISARAARLGVLRGTFLSRLAPRLALCALLLAATHARADEDPRDLARVHYDTGTGAYVRGDYKHAAEEFALADKFSPTPVALSAALDAALRADLPALGMELVQRAARAPNDPAIVPLAARARARFAKRTGHVRVTCAPEPCAVKIDGAPVDAGADRIVLAGAHVVAVDRGGHVDERPIDVSPEGRADIVFDATEGAPNTSPSPNPYPSQTQTPAPPPSQDSGALPPPTPAPAPSSGMSPVVFFTAAGLTTALAAVTLISAIDTSNRHSDYFNAGCDKLAPVDSGCSQAATDGASAQRRTNILLATTGAGAVVSAVIGIFFTQWHAAPVAVGVSPHGAEASLAVRLP